jgi:hypothetical protein
MSKKYKKQDEESGNKGMETITVSDLHVPLNGRLGCIALLLEEIPNKFCLKEQEKRLFWKTEWGR